MTTAQKALEQIQSIPAEDILIGVFTDFTSKCCIIGHLNRLNSENPEDYSTENCSDIRGTIFHTYISNETRIASRKFIAEKYPDNIAVVVEAGVPSVIGQTTDTDLSVVNNQKVMHWNQETPKERSIALLTEMVEAGY